MLAVELIAVGMYAPTIRAQEKPPAFEVVSIRPNNCSPCIPGAPAFTAGGVVWKNVTAKQIIQSAYHLTNYQFSGGPGWLDSDRFDLEAKAETPANESQLRQMLQSMLADRFKLVVHHETKEMLTYIMTVSKNGPKPKLIEVKPGEPAPRLASPPPGVVGNLVYRGNLQAFAEVTLSSGDPSRLIGRPVLDKTGLNGDYFFAVPWYENESVMTAVEDQLGLKFESQRVPMDTIVVEHIEKPSEN
jgi:uncharacterized protein (TIGR03435 family)